MVKCTFCGETLRSGTGKMYVQTDAKILYFCSNKCEKNMINLKRKSYNVKWSGKFTK
ncbi:MAG: 50S ribosomal protein L24e [Nanoarchaeota archaeon]|nr:50S ribosomal protein L24e [Nanoarchaeota archaeon]MBU1005148.1 50S ribosomal protein L24e [Nanoarchaeota archaeon]MBU1946387.1 50S ribosomal protein L24e [Nanoarchaeota archaeon]